MKKRAKNRKYINSSCTILFVATGERKEEQLQMFRYKQNLKKMKAKAKNKKQLYSNKNT
jgi:hypothetical protein